MTPLERAVVDAAIRYVPQLPSIQGEHALADAVNALLAARNAKLDAGQEYTWGEVVEGDEVFIPATKRWWPIIESHPHRDGRMRIIAKGAPKVLTPDPAGKVMVRRNETGKAVDMLNSILISGPAVVIRGDDDATRPAED